MTKSQKKTAKAALARAVKTAGGYRPLARIIGVDHKTIMAWFEREEVTPERHCPAIERAVNGAVTREELRPDFEWALPA